MEVGVEWREAKTWAMSSEQWAITYEWWTVTCKQWAKSCERWAHNNEIPLVIGFSYNKYVIRCEYWNYNSTTLNNVYSHAL